MLPSSPLYPLYHPFSPAFKEDLQTAILNKIHWNLYIAFHVYQFPYLLLTKYWIVFLLPYKCCGVVHGANNYHAECFLVIWHSTLLLAIKWSDLIFKQRPSWSSLKEEDRSLGKEKQSDLFCLKEHVDRIDTCRHRCLEGCRTLFLSLIACSLSRAFIDQFA